MTVWTTVERGEYIMIALAVIFVACIVIWWVRGASLRKERKSGRVLMQKVRDHIVDGDLENAMQVCKMSKVSGARIIESGINRIGKPMADVESAMKDAKDIEKERLARGARWLKTFAVMSPLLGLGGSLVGVIDRLRDLGEMGGAVDLSMICNQLAPTIVTTVAGLITGIFALVALTFLDASISVTSTRLDELSSQFKGLLHEPS